MKTQTKFPIGVFKYIPASKEEIEIDDSATLKVIDMDYFIESPDTMTFICKINNYHYPFELFKKFENSQYGIVHVLSEYARDIGINH